MIDIDFASHSEHVEPLRPALVDGLVDLRPVAGRIPIWSDGHRRAGRRSGMAPSTGRTTVPAGAAGGGDPRAASADRRPCTSRSARIRCCRTRSSRCWRRRPGGIAVASTRGEEPARCRCCGPRRGVRRGCELDGTRSTGRPVRRPAELSVAAQAVLGARHRRGHRDTGVTWGRRAGFVGGGDAAHGGRGAVRAHRYVIEQTGGATAAGDRRPGPCR